MVYRDISNSDSTPLGAVKVFRFKASLMDRFFSFLIDYLVFSPFVSFILYLLFQDPIRYWRANPDSPEQVSITILLGLSYVLCFSFLQALFIRIWKATPGQHFLKLQIVFETTTSFIFWRAFVRQCGFWLSIPLLGIPWLALLTHPLQKTFYDRMSDCRLLSKKQDSTFFTFESEARFWSSFTATMMVFIGALFFSILLARLSDVAKRTESFKLYEKKNFFCSELKDASSSSRLQLAIAMNLVGQLSDECLDHEADFVLWKEKSDEIELAYYAKSLTESDSEIETQYLRKACETKPDRMACRLSRAFTTAHFEVLYSYLKKEKGVLAETLAYEFSLILDKADEQELNLNRIALHAEDKLVKKYLLSELTFELQNSSGRSPASVQDEQERRDQIQKLIRDL